MNPLCAEPVPSNEICVCPYHGALVEVVQLRLVLSNATGKGQAERGGVSLMAVHHNVNHRQAAGGRSAPAEKLQASIGKRRERDWLAVRVIWLVWACYRRDHGCLADTGAD